MKMKKLLSAVMVGAMVMTTVPMVSLATTNTAYAAKGGAKLGGSTKAPAAAPKASAPSSNSNSKSVSGNGESYKPSKDAKSLSKDAPSASSKTSSAANTQSGSRWGSALRNIGLFAGGMFLGSMLSHLFGWGSLGWGADILGLLVNIFILYLVIKGAAALWRWLRDRRRR